MKRTRMYDLLCYLRSLKVDIYDENGNANVHWLLPESKKGQKAKIINKIYRFLGGYDEVSDVELFRIRRNKCCKHKNCVNPDCHTVYMRCDSKHNLTKDDYEELLQELDLDRYYKIGPTEYLKEINADMPDFLKIDSKTLTALIAFKRKKTT